MYVRPRTKENCKLSFLLCLSAATTLLLPVAAGTVRWVVAESATRVHFRDMPPIDSADELEVGLFRQCSTTPWQTQCEGHVYEPATFTFNGCTREMSTFGHRNRATAGFMLLAFFASLPLLVVSGMLFKQSVFTEKGTEVSLGPLKLNLNRRKGYVVRLGFALLTLFFTFLSICIYGDTMGRWYGCGDHFCAVFESQLKQRLSFGRLSVDMHREMKVNCGFGVSFAIAVGCFFFMIGYLIFLMVEFSMRKNVPVSRPPPAQSPKEEPTTEESQPMGRQGTTPAVAEPAPSSGFVVNTRLLPEGEDWEWDEETKLYWSQTQELFFDDASGHFYDPESESWFNPKTEEWYKM